MNGSLKPLRRIVYSCQFILHFVKFSSNNKLDRLFIVQFYTVYLNDIFSIFRHTVLPHIIYRKYFSETAYDKYKQTKVEFK